jgi:hypothetical protein
MAGWQRVLGLGFGLFAVACTPASGALGADGYEQSLIKYRVSYSDKAHRKFLPNDWMLDNYAYDSTRGEWQEKSGQQYRVVRGLDDNGDGTVSRSERKRENIFDLRFLNIRDNAVIWTKVHPLEPAYAGRDLDILLENYASGLEGSGIFEQSALFSLEASRARNFTTFMVKKEPTWLGPLPAIRSVIEIADVEKLRLDSTHRDRKAELVFAKVSYLRTVSGKSRLPWPVVSRSGSDQMEQTVYRCTGVLIVGYYNDATRFDAHVADMHSLLARLAIPASAVPPSSPAPSRAPAPAAAAPSAVTSAPAALPASAAPPSPVAAAPTTLPAAAAAPAGTSVPAAPAPTAAPAAPAPSAPAAAPPPTKK